ncbi:HPr kinase/phosphorylase [Nitratireductor sp. ZSWI3]|uniref:HPr kinase/phosphorylase n=1 Tax=Nitratireductor sp. ZSWI3 TaxID=2966359 RepID=UPI002150220F|nr:HPr kinase/phosphorylase [Nitratireductor sp. ZSWI3]MCR4265695.1 HPr kinase/phosphorylase [Nitratireductor sp. ZSWI3]
MHNRHATVLVIGDRGVLIEGASGTGKTTLALELLTVFSAQGLFTRLVCDDQTYLVARHGRLVAQAPGPIAGLAEARGFGPAPIAHQAAAVVDLVIRLVEDSHAPRVSAEHEIIHEGIGLPVLDLPARATRRALYAVAAFLDLPPFGDKQVTP